MAVSHIRMASMASSLVPRMALNSWISVHSHTVRMAVPFLPSIAIPVPGISIRLPSLQDIWEGILKAVPKKKTSHMKKRHRQMAGKALEDVNALCTCPGCGNTKRMHRLCPHCMKRINEVWKKDNPSGTFLE
ncbi:hypothetical protein TD95_001942 [Thielaviopsis punctulata]|uniref:Large ribosomal subunit protein bL32m n=1 Tax=Thielaviopsis punctulata TaxID=72032 RepID=A0A0F4ZGV2_9PEZI|nr:hypothetical protein TD95_001942 [Thielaviopsis punctulata]